MYCLARFHLNAILRNSPVDYYVDFLLMIVSPKIQFKLLSAIELFFQKFVYDVSLKYAAPQEMIANLFFFSDPNQAAH